MNLDDLKELDNFDVFKRFIKTFIVKNEQIFRLIYFPVSNPFSEKCIFPQESYSIFNESESNEHGVVLFKSKNSTVLNSSTPIVLIDFNSVKKTRELDTGYISIRIIVKDININELENSVNRSYAIAKLIDDELNLAKVNGLGETKRISFDNLSISEQNVGYTITYKFTAFNSDWSSNKNFKKRLLGDNYAN